VAARHVEVASR